MIDLNKKNRIYGLAAMCAIPFCFQFTCEMIQAQESELPEVKDVEITGDINEEKTGVDVFSDIDISLTVDNMS